ncbi:hypothetical protein HPP92_021875 [Vanilla planifolia]|uniref:DNA/RNA-binding protein Alba-like domain-containing protein n=1 Tax=Vanilla planifolia TaxID=51239 RepID=A0A835PWD5_VANPL|nr:hypothetical protein HPP92_021875 [Vanilla planifolia]
MEQGMRTHAIGNMDRYQRVEKAREQTPIKENEVRITTQGRMRSYITYAMSLLQENGSDEIVFKAMGRAINKTVIIVELIKRRIVGLHQITTIGSIDITDTWEPLEEGLLPLETTRHVSMVAITLSKQALDTSAPGYQLPLAEDQVKPSAEFDYDGGNGSMATDYDDGGWDGKGRGYGRGSWNRGRGRGFRGHGRGFGSRIEYQEDNGSYDEEYLVPPQRRGRGRGRGQGRGRGHGSRSTGPNHADAGT